MRSHIQHAAIIKPMVVAILGPETDGRKVSGRNCPSGVLMTHYSNTSVGFIFIL